MALRKIVTVGDDILTKVSKEVVATDERTKELVKDLIDTMKDAEAVGIAGVQVGILKRVAVVNDGEQQIVLINPKIVKTKGVQSLSEGCLSVPEITGIVDRPEYLIVKTETLEGKKKKYQATELLARAISHEIDHMDGILFTSKARELKKDEEQE